MNAFVAFVALPTATLVAFCAERLYSLASLKLAGPSIGPSGRASGLGVWPGRSRGRSCPFSAGRAEFSGPPD